MRERHVQTRDLRPGMVVSVYSFGRTGEATVAGVVRAADLIEPARAAVAKAKTRKALRTAAEELLAALEDVEDYGREARRVSFDGRDVPSTYDIGRDFRLVREGLRRP